LGGLKGGQKEGGQQEAFEKWEVHGRMMAKSTAGTKAESFGRVKKPKGKHWTRGACAAQTLLDQAGGLKESSACFLRAAQALKYKFCTGFV
jgi:hypothetical protein